MVNRFAAPTTRLPEVRTIAISTSEMVEPMKNMTRGKGSEPSKPFMKSLMTFLMGHNEPYVTVTRFLYAFLNVVAALRIHAHSLRNESTVYRRALKCLRCTTHLSFGRECTLY